jgi:hypothetical protein
VTGVSSFFASTVGAANVNPPVVGVVSLLASTVGAAKVNPPVTGVASFFAPTAGAAKVNPPVAGWSFFLPSTLDPPKENVVDATAGVEVVASSFPPTLSFLISHDKHLLVSLGLLLLQVLQFQSPGGRANVFPHPPAEAGGVEVIASTLITSAAIFLFNNDEAPFLLLESTLGMKL